MKLSLVVLVFGVACLNLVELITCSIVSTNDGRVEGTTMQSRRGVNFDAFLGIPFAKPPINELRFKAPVPVDSWMDILNGTAFRSACPQWEGLVPAASISEDCLQLNVFTKSLPNNGSNPMPVIAYIHGGGFTTGSAIISSPRVMMDRDIVFVTINYRLGAFGYLATGTREAPGNAAMKDQVLALRWIKRNIAAFGGDDENITVWGMSAGSISATAHMVSPLAVGLFHRVIAMSGSISSHTNMAHNVMDTVNVLAEGTNCVRTDRDEIVHCLRNRTMQEIITFGMITSDDPCPGLGWGAVIEPDFGQDRYLTDQPTDLFERGEFIHVPTIIGIMADEFAGSVPDVLNDPVVMKALNDDFDSIAPRCFFFENVANRSTALRERYFPYKTIDTRSFEDMVHLFSDSTMGYPTHLFVESVSKSEPYAAAHGDDIHYLIPWIFFAPIEIDHPDNFVVERLLSIYENFARNGNPNNVTDIHLSTMNWPVYNEEDAYYLDFGRHLIEKNGLYLNRYSRWT